MLSRKKATRNHKPVSHLGKYIKTRQTDTCQLYFCVPSKVIFDFLKLSECSFASVSVPSQHMRLHGSHQPHHKPHSGAFVLSRRDTSPHANGFRKHSFPSKKSSLIEHNAALQRQDMPYFTGSSGGKYAETQVLRALCLLS